MSQVPEVIRAIERGTYDNIPGLLAIEDAVRRRRNTLGIATIPRTSMPREVTDIPAFCSQADAVLDALKQVEDGDTKARIGVELHGKVSRAKRLLDEAGPGHDDVRTILHATTLRLLREVFQFDGPLAGDVTSP